MVPAYLERAAGHPDDAQRQGRPQEPARAERSPPAGRPRAITRLRRTIRNGRWPRCWPRCSNRRPGLGRRPFLRRARRQLAADGAVQRRAPRARRPAAGVDEGHLPAPDRAPAGGSRSGPGPGRGRRDAGPAAAGRLPARSRGRRRPAAGGHAARYVLCGALQLLAFAAYIAGFSLLWTPGPPGPSRAAGRSGIYVRLVVFGGGGLLAWACSPIVAKWLLIGRWKPRRIRAWSLGLLPVLAGQDDDRRQPDGPAVRRHPAVRAVPAGARAPGSAAAR